MPRSPSRDLVDRYTGNRGYFHQPDRIRRWKNWASLAALGLVVGWVVVELARPTRAAPAHTHGQLADPHAAFDANCEACHRPHDGSDFTSGPGSVFHTRDRWLDLTCTKCHAGPPHHANAADRGEFHNQCANCHHDHQGRGRSLVRLSDAHCTRCHADLNAATRIGKSDFHSAITAFHKDHPEFRALKPGAEAADRGLKFSHALHMAAGLVYDPNDRHPLTPEELGKRFGSEVGRRYAAPGGKPTDPVQLSCSSCHQLDAGRPADSTPPGAPAREAFDRLTAAIRGASQQAVLPPRAAGAYYLPINFDLHCKACHPVWAPAGVSGSAVLKEIAVPHRRQPAALRSFLRGEYAGRLAAPGKPVLNSPAGPGGRLDPPDPAVKTFGEEVDRLTDATLKALTLGITPAGENGPAKADGFRLPSGGYACGKCHFAETDGSGTDPAKVEIVSPPNRVVWFEHAAFNHVSHRSLTCASCHPGTGTGFAPGGRVNEREPVLIAGVKTCQACHAPAGMPVQLPDGTIASAAGIRHGCTDCHRYHNNDRPLQGLGAPARDPKTPLDLAEFLRGGK